MALHAGGQAGFFHGAVAPQDGAAPGQVDLARIGSHRNGRGSLVDVSALEIGKSVHVSDIAVPAGVEVLSDPEATVCVVTPALATLLMADAPVQWLCHNGGLDFAAGQIEDPATGHGDRGRLEPGLRADLVLWNADGPADLVYSLGLNACAAVVRKGELVRGDLR